MLVIVRTIILYTIVVASLRVMGKRQIGELQPSELVITLLISEVAALPIQDKSMPIKDALIPLITLIVFELLISILNIKSVKFRSLLQGNSLIIIRDGVVDQKQLKRMRYSMEDVLEELRKKNIFDLSQVQYAIAETDGTISVLPKPGNRTLTPGDLNLPVKADSFPLTVIDDGVIIKTHLRECGHTEESFEKLLKDKRIDRNQVLLMTLTNAGKINVIKKENKQ